MNADGLGFICFIGWWGERMGILYPVGNFSLVGVLKMATFFNMREISGDKTGNFDLDGVFNIDRSWKGKSSELSL